MVNPIRAAFTPGSSRIGRLDYLFSWVTSMLILGAGAVLTMILLAVVFSSSATTAQQADGMMNGAMPLVTLVLIMPASIYTGAVLGVKRLHDMGRTGRWMVVYYLCYAACLITMMLGVSRPEFELVSQVLSVVSALSLLLLATIPGSAGNNRYGPVPPKF